MKQIRTSALIGLGALGILFGRKMPGVQVIADEARIARYAAQPENKLHPSAAPDASPFPAPFWRCPRQPVPPF